MAGRRRSAAAGRRSASRGGARGRFAAGEDTPPDSGRGGAQEPLDPQQQARDICLRLLALRPRTRAELATALRRRSVPEDVAESVLERYGEVGMIDDAAFAEAWVTSRHHGRGLARRALAYELRRKGVDNSTVSEALDQLDPDTEQETAETLVRRKLRTLTRASPDAAFRKLVGMLARKGYSQGLAVRVVRDALAEASATAAADLDLDGLVDAAEAEDLDV